MGDQLGDQSRKTQEGSYLAEDLPSSKEAGVCNYNYSIIILVIAVIVPWTAFGLLT